MIAVEKLTDLEMSAASAIVCDGPHVLAVADDDVHLDAYNLATGRRGARILLLERSLPLEAKARKASEARLRGAYVAARRKAAGARLGLDISAANGGAS